MSGGNGLPCQSGLFSTSEKPLPLTVLAMMTVGLSPATWLAASVKAWSMMLRSCPSISMVRAPKAMARSA